jgi:hypothetical protein
MSERSPAAIPKAGICPSGWSSEANYCVEVKRLR